MRYEYIKQGFSECIDISWDDINRQIEYEVQQKTCRTICDNDTDTDLTYLLLDQQNFQPSIRKIHQEMIEKYNIKDLHIYTSKKYKGKTFGRHCDNGNVLIVQSIGKMDYGFDDGNVVSLYPGDGLYIPRGMYHDPISSEPRVTLSFSWS